MSSPAVKAGDASRPRSGILTPSSDGSLNHGLGYGRLSPDGLKRKREDTMAVEHLLKPSITLKSYPPNLHIPPRVLLPLMLLPREHLSLSHIDFNPSHAQTSPSRFFEATIKILDLETRLGSTPRVLIARSESRGTVHALERQDNGLYVVCQLGQWVDLVSLATKATATAHERLNPIKSERLLQASSLALTTPQLHKDQKQKRAAIEAIQSLVRKRARSQSVSTFEDATRREQDEQDAAQTSPPSPDIKPEQLGESSTVTDVLAVTVAPNESTIADESVPQQTANEIFDNIRSHYFDALYKSMGSLAYFAKGPLSRARSAFHLDLEANLDMADLIEFLKSLILTTVQVDKKYREKVPEIIANLKKDFESSDEGQKKKRKSKKMKLGKDGLYPAEDENVRLWWDANKPELKDHDVKVSEKQIKSHLSLLRTRETQLQMIVILEILALEPLKAQDEAGENILPMLPGTDADQLSQVDTPSAPPKKRNKHNLPMLIDVHADRLTIWQSTASDEQLLLEDTQANREPTRGQFQKSSSEPLKDFCVDVIVPFFSARLPQLCDAINRKLGGPVIVSPPKSKTAKRSTSTREQKPGSAAKRPAHPKTQRTLQRALSTDQLHRRSVSRGPSNAIALLRSATSTSVPGVKREGSEPANLKISRDIDPARQRSTLLSRSNSIGNVDDAKASRKAQLEAELKDAISALRKPNREVVGKAMAEAAQHRTLASLSVKKLKKLPRSSLSSMVQVKATPANNRYRNVLDARSEPAADAAMGVSDEIIPPSSIGPFLPSTAPRQGHRDMLLPDSASSSGVADTVGITPVKPSMRSSFSRQPVDDDMAIPPSSPLMERNPQRAKGLASDGNQSHERRLFPSSRDTAGLFETPVRKTMARSVLDVTPRPVNKPADGAMSIYQQLGWDDELDDF